jgi:hypothetical protein
MKKLWQASLPVHRKGDTKVFNSLGDFCFSIYYHISKGEEYACYCYKHILLKPIQVTSSGSVKNGRVPTLLPRASRELCVLGRPPMWPSLLFEYLSAQLVTTGQLLQCQKVKAWLTRSAFLLPRALALWCLGWVVELEKEDT